MSIKQKYIVSSELLADIVSVSKSTVNSWISKGKINPFLEKDGKTYFYMDDLCMFDQVWEMFNTNWDREAQVKPLRDYTSIELFAGAGGLARRRRWTGRYRQSC